MGFPGILLLAEIGERHIGALPGKGNGYGPADAAVATGDHRRLSGQLAATLVLILAAVGPRHHFFLDTRLSLALRRKLPVLIIGSHGVLLFGHGARNAGIGQM